MPDYKTLLVTQSSGVVTVQLNREAARNAMNETMITELTQVARELRAKPSVRAVILYGGPTLFSAGAEIGTDEESKGTSPPTLLERRESFLAGPDLCKAWEEIEPVTIAAIEGYCVGGACALVAALDFRIMSETAKLRLPEVPLGMNMSWRTLPRLATLVGPARAKRFAIFGEMTDAATCAIWGLADALSKQGEALSCANEWAKKLDKLPPLPVRMTKEAINAASNMNHHTASYMDRDQFLLTFTTDDLSEGIRAFFEKRDPNFKGN